MINFSAQVSAKGAQDFLKRLQRELPVALAGSASLLKTEMRSQIVAMDARDTDALLESVYETSPGGSDYQESVSDAAQAYQFNPSMYSFRDRNGGVLSVEPEVVPGKDGAFVGPAASHGIDVELGFVSPGGNQIPARPFVAATFAETESRVLEEFRQAVRRAL